MGIAEAEVEHKVTLEPETPSAPPWIKSYYPAFNGLRAVAITMVFLSHWGPVAVISSKVQWVTDPMFYWGLTGVDLFFVLSGFLITGILYDSRFHKSYFRTFYTRRALRIFPLYYSLWLTILGGAAIFHLYYSHYMLTYLAYVGNVFVPGSLLGHHGNPNALFRLMPDRPQDMLDVGVFWSLCVEEQFYLLWPFVVRWMPTRRMLMRVCVGGAISVLALRCILFAVLPQAVLESDFVYWSLFTRVDTLLVGAWLALWLRGAQPSVRSFRRLYRWLMVVPVAAVAVSMTLIGGRWPLTIHHPVLATYGFTLVALAGAGVLMACLDEASFLHRMLRLRPLARLGAISYGFYLLHDLFPFNVRRLMEHVLTGWVRLLILPVMFLLTYAVASLSFRYLEMPFLRLKHRIAPGEKVQAVAMAA